MGFDISQLDLDNIVAFAQRVVNLFAYRRNLQVRSARESLWDQRHGGSQHGTATACCTVR